LERTCTKPRKSEPDIKIGICSVGYRGRFVDEYYPVIICPERMKTKNVIEAVEKYHFGETSEKIKWGKEISLGVGGSIDYVIAKRKNYNGLKGDIGDFACVEFQACGTTGSPYPAIIDFKETGEFKKKSYNYGMNWANEFVKTMMQQVYKKGKKIEEWGEKMIWVIQDIGLKYLESEYDTSDLHKAVESDSIHFLTIKMDWDDNKNKWVLKPARKVSTDVDGVGKILLGAPSEEYPSLQEFKNKIKESIS